MIAISAIALAIIVVVAQSLLAAEVRGWASPLSRYLVRVAARKLPPAHRLRYREEWLAELSAFDQRVLTGIAFASRVLLRSRAMKQELGGARTAAGTRRSVAWSRRWDIEIQEVLTPFLPDREVLYEEFADVLTGLEVIEACSDTLEELASSERPVTDVMVELSGIVRGFLDWPGMDSPHAFRNPGSFAWGCEVLAPYLPREALEELADFALKPRYGSPFDQARALSGIAPHLAEEALRSCLDSAGRDKHPFRRMVLLEAVVPVVPETLHNEADYWVSTVRIPEWRTALRQRIGVCVRGPGSEESATGLMVRAAVYQAPVSSARGLDSPAKRIVALTLLATALPLDKQIEVLREALEPAEALPDEMARSRVVDLLTAWQHELATVAASLSSPN